MISSTKRLLASLIVISLVLCSIPKTDAGGLLALSGFDYRREITITGSAGAGTNYQVLVNVTYDSDMQTNFGDLRFTDDDGITEIDYWIQNYTASSFALVWVEVTANLDSAQSIYMYYGNSTVSTTSDGSETFNAFFDNTSTSGWTLSDIDVSTSGEYLRFNNSINTNVGMASRFDLSTPADFQLMSQYKTVSLGAKDQYILSPCDGSTSHRFAMSITPKDTSQTSWYYYDGSMKLGGSWVEGSEFIYTIQVDEGDSTNGIDYRRYNQQWTLLDSKLTENFALGSPTDCDGIFLGDAGGDAYVDVYIRWMAFRKCIDSEPVPTIGAEEIPPNWTNCGTAGLTFSVLWIAAIQFGYDAFFIFLGLIMIPVSTMYLVRGGRKELSTEKVFYALIIFFLGCGLVIGGVIP